MKQKVKPLSEKERELLEDMGQYWSPILDENDEPIILPTYSKEYIKRIELWKKKRLNEKVNKLYYQITDNFNLDEIENLDYKLKKYIFCEKANKYFQQ